MPTLAQRLRDEGRSEGRNEGIIEGRKEGRNEGIYEGKLETARRMLREDFTIEQIARITGLSEEELKKAFSEK